MLVALSLCRSFESINISSTFSAWEGAGRDKVKLAVHIEKLLTLSFI